MTAATAIADTAAGSDLAVVQDLEGAYAISQTLGGPKGPGKEIVSAAEALVEAQLTPLRRRH